MRNDLDIGAEKLETKPLSGDLLGVNIINENARCEKIEAMYKKNWEAGGLTASIFGTIIKILAIAGVMCFIFTLLTKIKINVYFEIFENAAFICANACVTLSDALPFMFIVSKLLCKPLNKLGSKIGVNGVSTLAFLG